MRQYIETEAGSALVERLRELVIMIEAATEEMHGSDRVADLKTDCKRGLVGTAHLQRERNGALFGVQGLARSQSA
jgi:hypothetical protein